MPGFGRVDATGPSLPLHLYGLGADAERITRGPAPLALRLFVEAVLSAPEKSTVRVLDAVYRAADVLNSFEASIPWIDPETGQTGNRLVVMVSDIGNRLDDTLQLTVNLLPPGTVTGPTIPSSLGAWGAKSAIAYRGLIGLAYRWYEPGRTHTPVGSGRRRYWIRSHDPLAYPELSDAELVDLFYPHLGAGTGTNRRNRMARARETLTHLAAAGEVRISGRRVLPPPDAIEVTETGSGDTV